MLILPELSPLNNLSAIGFEYLLDASLKALLTLFLASCLKVFIRYTSAATRHFVLCITFFCLLSIPFVSLMLPTWNIPLLRFNSLNKLETPVAHEARLTDYSQDDSSNALNLSLADESGIQNKDVETPSQISNFSFSLYFWIFLIYLMGAIRIITRWLIGIEKVWRISRRSTLITDPSWIDLEKSLRKQIGIRKQVKIYRSFNIPLPVTFGFWRPVVLLPITCLSWSESRRRTVLLHEFAHIKRQDCATQGLSHIVCALYWFNPLVWLTASKLRLEAEHACDDIVLAHQVRASDYANDLLDFARYKTLLKSYWTAVAVVGQTHLEKRLRLILNQQTARHTLTGTNKILICTIFISFALPISSARFLNSEKESVGLGIVTPETSEGNNPAQVIKPIFELSSNARAVAGHISSSNLKNQKESERQKTNSPSVPGVPSKSAKKNLDESADLLRDLNKPAIYPADKDQNLALPADFDNSERPAVKPNSAKPAPSGPHAFQPGRNLMNMADFAGFMAGQAKFMANQAKTWAVTRAP